MKRISAIAVLLATLQPIASVSLSSYRDIRNHTGGASDQDLNITAPVHSSGTQANGIWSDTYASTSGADPARYAQPSASKLRTRSILKRRVSGFFDSCSKAVTIKHTPAYKRRSRFRQKWCFQQSPAEESIPLTSYTKID